MVSENKKQEKQTNKFVSVVKAIFVHNIGWKLLAIGASVIIWALSAGLL